MSNLKQRLYASKSGKNTIPYKRLFLQSGKEYNLRFLTTEFIDAAGNLFARVFLHGGYKHPNYQQKYTSNFRCLGKNCPMCADFKEQRELEKNLPKEQRIAWRKKSIPYAVYWAINLDNNELSLVHVPMMSAKDKKSIQDIIFEHFLEAAEQDKDPFSLKSGNDVFISIKMVDNVPKVHVTIKEETTAVSEKVQKMASQLVPFEKVYKQYSKEQLQNIVDGVQIVFNNDKKNQEKNKEEVKTEMNEVNNEDESNFIIDEGMMNEFDDSSSESELSEELDTLFNTEE